jgi:hypothetical protein
MADDLAQSERKVVATILGNPAMIDAYRAGIPGNGKPVPDGAKMAKIHWSPKPNEFFPDATVPGNLVKRRLHGEGQQRFADSGGWDNPVFDYNAGSDTFDARQPKLARRRRGTTPGAGSQCHTKAKARTDVFTEYG